jgi:MATE family multidrug resistance protein
MSLIALLMLPWVREICAFVTPDPEVQAVAAAYLKFNIAATPFSVTGMVMSGIFIGAGATVYSLAAFAPGIWLVRLPLAWYMGHCIWRDASGIFLAMLISQAVQASLVFYLFMRRDWQRFASTAGRWKKRTS